MKVPGETNRYRVWMRIAVIAIGAACLIWAIASRSRSMELTLAIPNSRPAGTQIVVSVVFTNTSGRPLVCARNSLVERLTPDGWTTSTFNNFSKPDPLMVWPGQVGRFDLRLAPETTRVRITTQISPMGWHWLLLSSVPEEWIPNSIGKILEGRFGASCHFAPVSSAEVSVTNDFNSVLGP